MKPQNPLNLFNISALFGLAPLQITPSTCTDCGEFTHNCVCMEDCEYCGEFNLCCECALDMAGASEGDR